MIIIKTKNGDVFLNEKEVIYVEHEKKNKRVYISAQNRNIGNIENVESVTFISDTEPIKYKDEGSEVVNLKAQAKEREENINKVWNLMFDIKDKLLSNYSNLDAIIKSNPDISLDIKVKLKDEIEKLHSNILEIR